LLVDLATSGPACSMWWSQIPLACSAVVLPACSSVLFFCSSCSSVFVLLCLFFCVCSSALFVLLRSSHWCCSVIGCWRWVSACMCEGSALTRLTPHTTKSIVRQCPTLPPSSAGSTIGAGGLSFRVRKGGPGVSPPL